MSRRLRFLAPGATLLVAVVAVLVIDQPAVNADGTSYLAISRHWAEGRWDAAINGYWSPLLSLSIAPATALGVPLLTSAKVCAVVVATGAVAALQRLMLRAGVGPFVAVALAAGTAPFAVFAALDNFTPDLLMAALLVVFLAEFVPASQAVVRRPLRAGVLGGVAFLAKAYALPFVLAFLAVGFVAALAVERRARRTPGAPGGRRRPGRTAWARLVVTTAATVLIAALWSIVISVDAGRATFSTAAEYNRAITSPGSQGDPYDWAGLIEPDHPEAIWGWEDPPAMIPDGSVMGPAPVDESRSDDIDGVDVARPPTPGRAERVVDNAVVAARSAALVAGATVVAALAIGWALWRALRRRPRRDDGGRDGRDDVPGGGSAVRSILVLGVAGAIYTGGLLVLTVTARYLFFVLLLVVAIAGIGLQELVARGSARRWLVVAVVIAVSIGTATRSGVALYRLDDRADALRGWDDALGRVELEGRRLASSPADLTAVGARCLVEGCVYLGSPTGRDASSLADQFEDFDVDLFVVLRRRPVALPSGARLLSRSAEPAVEVYEVSNVSGTS